MATSQAGERIADRYVLAEQIGEGGMGVVYSARDDKLRRTVAVKMLPPERAGNKVARARLQREARAAAALDNPGIAQVYDVGDTPDGGAYLVMEYVRGKSLRTLAKKMNRGEILRIVREVARTLQVAHKEGLVHRDVKPDNIMVRDDGRVVLLDFGIAKEVSRDRDGDDADSVITAKGAVLGTPPYIAPEQIRARDVGPASDQFALAVVAFQLLTTKKPWEAPSDLGMLGQILTEPPKLASEVATFLPAAIDPVFTRAMAKEPKDRYEDVEAFAEALEAVLNVKPLSIAPPPMEEKAAGADEPAASVVERAPPSALQTSDGASSGASGTRWVIALLLVVVIAAAAWYVRHP